MYFAYLVPVSSILENKCREQYLQYPSLYSAMKSPEAKCNMNAKLLIKKIIWLSSLLSIHKNLTSGKHLSMWTSTHNKTGLVLFTKAEAPLTNWTDSFNVQVYIRSL